MDLVEVHSIRVARTVEDLALTPGETVMAGGTWLYSEPQPGVTGLVDLTGLGWDAIERTADGALSIGAMVTIADLAAWADASTLTAGPLVRRCAESLLASFKVQVAATVGGNIAKSYAAGAMIALAATLDGTVEIWRADGTHVGRDVASIPADNGVSTLAPGDVIRRIVIPQHALAASTAHRRIALATHGRSGALLTGRRDADGACTLVITAATRTPVVLRYRDVPAADAVVADVLAAPGYYTDPLGSADWRRAVAATLLAEVAEELA